MIQATLEEKVNGKARDALVREAKQHPFRSEALNLPYLYIREMVRYLTAENELHLIQAQPSIILPPAEMTEGLKEKFRVEIGYAESMLYRFVEKKLIHAYWNNYPLEAHLLAYGMCPVHNGERIRYDHLLTESDIKQIENIDNVLTPENIVCMASGVPIMVPVESSSFVYSLQPGAMPAPDRETLVTQIACRAKLDSMGKKLAMGAVGYKEHPLDFMGARVVCPGMESYHHVVRQFLKLILDKDNQGIDLVPVDGAVEEHVSIYRPAEDRVETRDRDLISSLGSRFTTIFKEPNGELPYESTHMTLINPLETDPAATNPIELQIRTEEMDKTAEQGAAAHWLYKQNETKAVIKNYPPFIIVANTLKDIYGFPGRRL
jgi:hypothetical protein